MGDIGETPNNQDLHSTHVEFLTSLEVGGEMMYFSLLNHHYMIDMEFFNQALGLPKKGRFANESNAEKSAFQEDIALTEKGQYYRNSDYIGLTELRFAHIILANTILQ